MILCGECFPGTFLAGWPPVNVCWLNITRSVWVRPYKFAHSSYKVTTTKCRMHLAICRSFACLIALRIIPIICPSYLEGFCRGQRVKLARARPLLSKLCIPSEFCTNVDCRRVEIRVRVSVLPNGNVYKVFIYLHVNIDQYESVVKLHFTMTHFENNFKMAVLLEI